MYLKKNRETNKQHRMMGKVPPGPPPPAVAATAELTPSSPEINKPKKKKGRPSLIDLQKRNLPKQEQEDVEDGKTLITSSSSAANQKRRSTRRNNSPELVDDDEDERKQKKVKLVVRLPQSKQQQHFDNLGRSSSSFTSDDEDGGNKANVNTVDHRSADNQEKVSKTTTDPRPVDLLGSGPTTPLPDKKLLVFILDRLQKKDAYGVFSEPVDPNELPDYHEIIEHPMDFGTVRRKLDAGSYSNLEQLEADVLLICSNAMQYNSSDTVYFRQARSIQELAKRDFENLRHEGDDGELRPKVVRRGRPPGKHLMKPSVTTSADCLALEISEEPPNPATADDPPTHAVAEENTNGSAYNLRRGSSSYKSALSSQRPRSGENYSEWLADWNDEFPASILRADMKYGKKLGLIDETRRETYKRFHPTSFGHEPVTLSDFGEGTKQLMPVGLEKTEHSYATSLARFAADLGPVAWEIASKKIASVLPPGVKFGRGYVGEVETPLQSTFPSSDTQNTSSTVECDGNKSGPVVNSVIASGFQERNDLVETDRRAVAQNNLDVSRGTPLFGIRPEQGLNTANKTVFDVERDGFKGVFGYSFPSQMGSVGPSMKAGHSGPVEVSLPSQLPNMVPKSDWTSTLSTPANHVDSEEQKRSEKAMPLHSGISMAPNIGSDLYTGAEGKPSWQAVTQHPRQNSVPVQPDLNVRLQAPSSPSSGLRVGSPQQPDLALQL